MDGEGNLLIADRSNSRIRRVEASTGVIATVAGNGSFGFSGDGGPATSASLGSPTSVAVDGQSNIFIAEWSNNRIRKVDASTGVITTVVGDGTQGFSGDGGPAISASLARPDGVAVDGQGNIFIADNFNQRIRRVDASTGVITTVVGDGIRGSSGDGGPAIDARLSSPRGIAVDDQGNIFIADSSNSRIRRVDGSTGVITTVAGGEGNVSGDGGQAADAFLVVPSGVAVDGQGNIFIADNSDNRIRRVDASTGVITTVAGGFVGDGGPATSASLHSPHGVAVDGQGNIFIAEWRNNRIRRVDSSTGVITTVAGDGTPGFSGDGGPATIARLRFPRGVAVDGQGNIFIADASSARIRRVDGSTGVITTVAGDGVWGFSGDGGPATSARLNFPTSVAVDGQGNLFIADLNNNRIRRVDGSTGVITTVAGDGGGQEDFSGDGQKDFSGDGGPAIGASLANPYGVAVDGQGNIFIADESNNRIRRVDTSTGVITTVAGDGVWGFSGDGGPATDASLRSPWGVTVDGEGNLLIADRSNNRIRRVDASTGVITTVAGYGVWGFSGDGEQATNASLASPYGVAVDGQGNIFIADTSNDLIRMVTVEATSDVLCNRLPATIVGTDGPDVLIGTPGDDVIVGLQGDDEIRGLGGNDTICAGGGNDMVWGGGGRDVIFGGPGNDELYGNRGRDVIKGGLGSDTIRGGFGNDTLYGGPGPDRIYGGVGNDRLFGGPGDDELRGGRDDDRLRCGPGFDIGRGGPGVDTIDDDCENALGGP